MIGSKEVYVNVLVEVRGSGNRYKSIIYSFLKSSEKRSSYIGKSLYVAPREPQTMFLFMFMYIM